MRYTKPPISFEAQADLLLARGLHAEKSVLVARLRAVSYYRISAYVFPYRQPGSDNFQPETTLDLVWRHYTFDRQLRILVMDAIERVEVAVRTQLICRFANRYGAFAYLDHAALPGMGAATFAQWVDELREETRRSREPFMAHFRTKYGDHHDMPPIWMLAELMPFGRMLTLFKGVEASLQRDIAQAYRIPDAVLKSWLVVLNVGRNICAHHGRLWNRELGVKPLFPYANKYPQWHRPVAIPNNRIFAVLTILRYLLGTIAPTSAWPDRLRNLLARYPEVSTASMGFPANWDESPIWRAGA